MRKALHVIFSNARVLWLVVLGVTLFVPVLLMTLLIAFGVTHFELYGQATALFSLVSLFGVVFVAVVAYFHCLLIQAAARLQQKNFSLLACFQGARGLYWRVLGLHALVLVPAVGLFVASLFGSLALSYVLLALAGLWLILVPFAFLRAPVFVREQPLGTSLRLAASEVFSKAHYFRWGSVKITALVLTLLYFAISSPDLLSASWSAQLVVLAGYFFSTLLSVLVPGFALANAAVFSYTSSQVILAAHLLVLLPLQVFFVLLVTTYLSQD